MNKTPLLAFSIGAIVVLFLAALAWQCTSIEFASESIKENVVAFYLFAIPVCMALGIAGPFTKSDSPLTVFLKVALGAVLSVAYLFFATLFLFGSMCSYTTRQVLYISKQDVNRKIVVRDFGCGATDSSPATLHIQEVQTIGGLFIKVSKADTTNLNPQQWVRVNSPN